MIYCGCFGCNISEIQNSSKYVSNKILLNSNLLKTRVDLDASVSFGLDSIMEVTNNF